MVDLVLDTVIVLWLTYTQRKLSVDMGWASGFHWP